MKALLFITALQMFNTSLLFAQRAFAVQADSLTRYYFVSAPGQETASLAQDFGSIHPEQNRKEFNPYKKHVSFAITLGRWQQAGSSRTEFDTTTFVDIAKSHFIIGIQVEYNFTERLSVLTDVNFLTIPEEQGINTITIGSGGIQATGSGHGGIVIPYGAGIRYAFPHRNFRPFITATMGLTYIRAEGGTSSGGLFTGTTENITKKIVNVFTYSLGAGFDYRLYGAVSFRISTSYFMSNRIDPEAGSINAFRGLSVMTGLAFVLGK